jgi:hypothetical protein
MVEEKLTQAEKSATIDIPWDNKFPPLNLWNYPSKWVSEIFYKDNDVWHQRNRRQEVL